MKLYVSDDKSRGILVNDSFDTINRSFGFTNVLCCDPEGLIETEDLHYEDESKACFYEWDDSDFDRNEISDLASNLWNPYGGWTSTDREMVQREYCLTNREAEYLIDCMLGIESENQCKYRPKEEFFDECYGNLGSDEIEECQENGWTLKEVRFLADDGDYCKTLMMFEVIPGDED